MRRYDVADQSLLQQVADGDEAALRALFDEHAPWLRLRLQRRTSDSDLIAEVIQDTFLVVWRSAGRYRGDGDVGAWMWGIAIRRLISRLRGHREPSAAEADVIAAASPPARSAEDELLVAMEYGDLGTALRSLSPELQRIVQAMVIDGLSSKEAAQLLGIPQGTAKSRMRAAKGQLRGIVLDQKGGLS